MGRVMRRCSEYRAVFITLLRRYWWVGAIATAVLAIALVGFIYYADATVRSNAGQRLYDDTDSIPKNNVGVLLGVNKFASSGRQNLFYTYRINAAVELFEAGKINYVLVSGDNSTEYYDEPTTMKEDLLERGIPEDRIILDYAGFRTWDSVVRASKVFGQESFTVISQAFHNERAVYVGQANDLDVIGFDARDVPVSRSPRVWLRERLARVNVVLDVWRGVEPKFLGEPVVIPVTQE